MARKSGKAKARMTPYDPQGTKKAGKTGTTKPKKTMARKKVGRASPRRSR